MRYFDISEFDSPDSEGSGRFMDETFLNIIDELRHQCNFPFKINSGFRTESHNEKVGGSPRSSHLKGIAADIHCTESAKRFKIVEEAIKLGITRIGISNTFIHIDTDRTKTQDLIWTY